MVPPFPTAGLLGPLGRRLELKVHPASLPSDRLSTGEGNGPARTLVTTQGLWQPPTLASDVSGDETVPESLTPRYCHSHGLFSRLSSHPPSVGDRVGSEHGRAGPAGTRSARAVAAGVRAPCQEPRSGTRHLFTKTDSQPGVLGMMEKGKQTQKENTQTCRLRAHPAVVLVFSWYILWLVSLG